MFAMVETWIGELGKLRDKVRPQNPSESQLKQSFGEVGEEEKAKEESGKASRRRSRAQNKTETTLSEATVCMLMDRFAPW